MSEGITNLNVTTPIANERKTVVSDKQASIEISQTQQAAQNQPEKIEQRRAAEKEIEQQQEQDAIEEVASKLQEFVNLIDKKLQFSVDEDSGRQVVRVTDKLSGDVIRQIPSEDVLRLARNLSELAETANRSGKLIVTEA